MSQQQELIVRPSTEDDVPAMIAIYMHHVQFGNDDRDYEPIKADDIKRRRRNMLRRKLPHLVAERNGEVVGYAYAVPFRKRPAYRFTVKHSIYVHPDHLGTGIGTKLLPELIDACADAGFRQMIAYVDSANTPSIQLHISLGFFRVGLLPSVGFKFGRWTDSLMLQRELGTGGTEPPSEWIPRPEVAFAGLSDLPFRTPKTNKGS